MCERRGIRVLAHRVRLGGPEGRCAGSNAIHPIVTAIAERHGATPAEIALAWIGAQSPAIVPLPGATRIETCTQSSDAPPRS